ncbi:MAG: hypothetical protein ACE5OZ_15675 [Candidatus Heimdallarchaeota archaeon]
MGRGFIPAILSVFLPTYILIYNLSESDSSSIIGVGIGLYTVVTLYSSSSGGESTSGSATALFNPNWYLDLEGYMTDFSYSSDAETQSAEVINNFVVSAAYGNLKEALDDSGNLVVSDLALGLSGMLFGSFIALLIVGIILNLMDKEKISGYLFLIGGILALAAMYFAYDGITALYEGTSGNWIPIPFGALLVLFAGYRAVTAKEVGY